VVLAVYHIDAFELKAILPPQKKMKVPLSTTLSHSDEIE
jgi:hypothetical protein